MKRVVGFDWNLDADEAFDGGVIGNRAHHENKRIWIQILADDNNF